MKKTTIVMSAISLMALGAISTSCVKDNESQSVTEIRNAKAEQLKAMATLSKAQAEAALINANATKVLMEAQAQLALAEAAFKQAEADGEQVKVEEAKLAYEKAKATAQLEIDAAIARAEAAKIQAQATLIAAKAAADAAALENPYLTALIGKYSISVADLNNASSLLTVAKTQLIQDKYDLQSWEATRDYNVMLLSADKNAKIKEREAYVKLSETYTDYSDIKAAIAECEAKIASLSNEVSVKTSQRNIAFSSLSDEKRSVENTEYYSAVSYLRMNVNNGVLNGPNQSVKFKSVSQKKSDPVFGSYIYGLSFNHIDFIDESLIKMEQVKRKDDLDIVEKQYNTDNTDYTAKLAAEKTANDDMVTKKADYDADPTNAAKQNAYITAKSVYVAAQAATVAAYDKMNNAINGSKFQYESAKSSYESFTKFTAIVFDADKKTVYETALAEFLANDMKVIDMNIEMSPMNAENTATQNVLNSLKTEVNNVPNFADLISRVDNQIAFIDRDIASAEDISGKDDAIAYTEAQIKTYEAQVSALTAVVNKIYDEIQKEINK